MDTTGLGEQVTEITEAQRIERTLRCAISLLEVDEVWEEHWCEMYPREELLAELEALARRPRGLMAVRDDKKAARTWNRHLSKELNALENRLREAEHELASARAAATGWKDLYDGLRGAEGHDAAGDGEAVAGGDGAAGRAVAAGEVRDEGAGGG